MTKMSREDRIANSYHATALPGRATEIPVSERHHVSGNPLTPPFPAETETALFGLGCFWGAEKKFWEQNGVYSTAVGYAGGVTLNPTYEEVCSGRTGHNEAVRVVFYPRQIPYETLLKIFFESHDPTQGMRQGNDMGTQYRSSIYTYSERQKELAESYLGLYQEALRRARKRQVITTEILDAPVFYYAEDYHQQYLSKNPNGYCGLGGTGVQFQDVSEKTKL